MLNNKNEPNSPQEKKENMLHESEEAKDYGHYSFFTEISPASFLTPEENIEMEANLLKDWFPAVGEEPLF